MSEESSTPATHCPNCKKIASSCGGGGEATNDGYANCLACDVTWGADAQTRDEIVRLWRGGALAGDGRIAKVIESVSCVDCESATRPYSATELEDIRRLQGGAEIMIDRLIATIAERDKSLDDATVMLDVSNQQLAEIRGTVGDGPAAEAVRRALAEKDAEIERLVSAWTSAMAETDNLARDVNDLEEERAEVRKIVDARDGESTPDALHRALRELFDLYMGEMTNLAGLAADSIEENMRVGAKGMRDACAQIAGALSTSPNAFVAATSAGIRKAIEALPLP